MTDIIKIKIDGADAVIKKLNEVSKRAGNLRPILKAIGDRVVEQTQRRFESGGPAPDGTAWAKVKNPKPRARGILRVSDQLKNSIMAQLQGSNAVAIGTNKVYGAIHQLGGETEHSARTQVLAFKRGGGFLSRRAASRRKTAVRVAFANIGAHATKIPARPYLGISNENSKELLEVAEEYISEVIK